MTAAPSMTAKVELSIEQKHQIAATIDQLQSQATLSTAEEAVLNLLQAILPDRLPQQTRLLANHPNSFNPETWIPFGLTYSQAEKAIYWDGRNANGESVSSGVYFYRLQAGDYSQTRKMVILK